MTVMPYSAFSFSTWEPAINLSEGSEAYTFKSRARHEVEHVDAYRHKISRFPGYDDATISFKVTRGQADSWLSEALNWHIEVYDNNLGLVWVGFINSIQVDYGSVLLMRGPLLDVINTVSVVYTRLFTDTTPPVSGGKWQTTIAPDTNSRNKYGVLEDVYTAGTVSLEAAEQVRDTRLEEHREPQLSEELTFGNTANLTVTLECLGYLHRTKKWIYEDETFHSSTLSGRIASVMDDDPQAMYALGSNPRIATNSVLVGAREDEERYAWDVLKWLNSVGDVNENIYRMGVFDNNNFFYQPVPTEFEYYYKLFGESGLLVDTADNPVPLWRIQPAKWLLVSDVNIGQTQTATPQDDPRASLIESVEFTAPNQINLERNKFSRLDQKLNQLGLGGTI